MFSKAAIAACLLLHGALASAETEDPVKQAQRAADLAYDAYREGDYPAAVSRYLDSYRLYPTAESLFNVAKIYDRKLNNPSIASNYYRRCIGESDASPELVAKANARLAALSETRATPPELRPREEAQAPVVTAKPPPPKEPGQSGLKVTGVVLASAGAASLGTSGVFGWMAGKQHSEAVAAGCGRGSCPTEEARTLERSAARDANVATATLIAGGALVAGGALLYWLAPSAKSSSTRVSLVAGPGHSAVAVSGNF